MIFSQKEISGAIYYIVTLVCNNELDRWYDLKHLCNDLLGHSGSYDPPNGVVWFESAWTDSFYFRNESDRTMFLLLCQ